MTDLAEAQRKAAIRRAAEARAKVSKDLRDFVGERIPVVAKGGNPMPLKFYPDPVLDEPCSDVEDFGDDLRQLVESMAVTMYMTGGVGLAANQVGVTKRVFVCDMRQDMEGTKSDLRIFVNPVVVSTSEETEMLQEGCLSFPGVHENISRPTRCRVRAQTVRGDVFEVDLAGGEARVALHEIDHLNGVTWLDHMGELQRRMALKKASKIRRAIVLDERSEAKAKKRRGGKGRHGKRKRR